MRVVAVAARERAISTWMASGARPLLSPPLTSTGFQPGMIEGGALLFVCAHGLPGGQAWYGRLQPQVEMCTADQVAEADLRGVICYLAACYGAGPMSDALLAAGASAVVADIDAAFAGLSMFRPAGASELGRLFRLWLETGLPAGAAFDMAHAEYGRRHSGDRDRRMLETVVFLGDRSATARREP